jgi:hypothetical protein
LKIIYPLTDIVSFGPTWSGRFEKSARFGTTRERTEDSSA